MKIILIRSKNFLIYLSIFLLIFPSFSYGQDTGEIINDSSNNGANEIVEESSEIVEESSEIVEDSFNDTETTEEKTNNNVQEESQKTETDTSEVLKENDEENQSTVNSKNQKQVKKNQSLQINTILEFKLNDKHPAVIDLKNKLVKLGFGGMNINEKYGSFTVTRVKQLQEYYDFPRKDGVADQETLRLIDEILATPFQQGKKHPDVIALKEKLIALGYGGMNISETYGSFTAKRVKEFQKDHGLKQNGIVDPVTKQKIDSYFPSVLKKNVRSPLVIELKEKLVKLGFGGMNINEKYGSFTVTRVKQLQEYYDFPRKDGVADQETLRLIDEILATPFQQGKKHPDVITIKEQLILLGYGGMNINQTYGSFTAKRVKEFQKDFGLKVNGIVDPVTYKKLFSDIHIYREGVRHPLIIEFKKKLELLGFGGMNINEHFGSFTTTRVKQFQQYYGLEATGIVDQRTLDKLNEQANTNLQEGRKHPDVITFKQNLKTLGFGGMNINETYGSFTATKVRQFQQHYGLKVNGVGDEKTLQKINEILSSPFQEGKEHPDVIPLKEKLIKLGYGGMNRNQKYGSFTAKRVREFQKDFGLPVSGIADEITLQMIELASKGIKYTKYNITLEEALDMQMKVKPQTDNRKYAWVHSDYIDSNNKVTASALRVRTQPSTSKDSEVIGTLSKGTKVNIVGIHGNWYAIDYTNGYHWIHATKDDTLYYLNPNNFINDKKQRFQFLDLSKPSGATKYDLNKFLKGKGVLEGKGQAFIDAARIHRINDVYLISHALHETGNGNSDLAKGIEVGKNSNKQPVLVTSSNKNSLTEIETVHNVYGIGAYDDCPKKCGAITAYNNGWFTVEDAIIGGAAFIGNDYIKAGQNTLYKMRWNPQAMVEQGKATHQYATDIGWASKQVDNMYKLYQEIGINTLYLDIPQYK